MWMNQKLLNPPSQGRPMKTKRQHRQHLEENRTKPNETTNQEGLIVDVICAPVNIQHPTNLRLLNESREHTENIET